MHVRSSTMMITRRTSLSFFSAPGPAATATGPLPITTATVEHCLPRTKKPPCSAKVTRRGGTNSLAASPGNEQEGQAPVNARQVVFAAPRQVELRERSLPEPGPDQALLRTLCTLISTGTELTALTGDFPPDSVWARYIQYP